MEYQLTDEISEFWREMVPPIFLVGLSILCFLWVIGKDNRRKLMKILTEDRSRKVVEENGIFFYKEQMPEYIFTKKVLGYTGFESIKPIVAVFLMFLSFYGVGRIVFFLNPPRLSIHPSGILFATGVSSITIAEIWMFYPDAKFFDLVSIIETIAEAPITREMNFADKVYAFIFFDLICCVILLFAFLFKFRKLNSDPHVYRRLFAFGIVLVLIMGCMLLVEIHNTNEDMRQYCYRAHSKLMSENHITGRELYDREDYQKYLDAVNAQKEACSDLPFYGAYSLHFRYGETFIGVIVDVCQELFRLLGRFISKMNHWLI